jgi:hypothetical protein
MADPAEDLNLIERVCVCKRIFWRRWCDTETFIWSFIAFQIHGID